MSIQIIAPSDRTSKILSDLGKRRATILDVNSKGQNNKVKLYYFIALLQIYKNTQFILDYKCTGATVRVGWLF